MKRKGKEVKEDAQTIKDERPKWRKIGRGSLRLGNGKIVKVNEVFRALPEDLPKGALDLLVCIEGDGSEVPANLPEEEKVLRPKRTGPLYEIKVRNPGWYDVTNTVTGKAVNDTALRQEDAAKLLKELTDEPAPTDPEEAPGDNDPEEGDE